LPFAFSLPPSAFLHHSYDSPPRHVAGREFQPDPVTDQHPDEVPARAARGVRGHVTLALDPNPVEPVRQLFDDRSLDRRPAGIARILLGQQAAIPSAPPSAP
jgi:hypothetical protein